MFRSVLSNIMSRQKHLDGQHHTDSFRRDRSLILVDLPAIQSTLRDCMPRSSQQAVQRIPNQFSEKPISARSTSVCWSRKEYQDRAYYSLGNTFGWDARRTAKPPWKTFNTYQNMIQSGRGGRKNVENSKPGVYKSRESLLCLEQDHK